MGEYVFWTENAMLCDLVLTGLENFVAENFVAGDSRIIETLKTGSDIGVAVSCLNFQFSPAGFVTSMRLEGNTMRVVGRSRRISE
jgi:hypothetical protein